MVIQIVLRLAKRSSADLLVESDFYTTQISGNSKFSAPEFVKQVATTKTATEALRTKMNETYSDTKTNEVKSLRGKLENQLRRLANLVANLANADEVPEDEKVNIVHLAGMSLKSLPAHHPQEFTVRNGPIPGTVILTAKGRANGHEWHYYTDPLTMKNRVILDGTTVAHLEISGLESDAKLAFIHHSIIRGEKTEWDGPITITVK